MILLSIWSEIQEIDVRLWMLLPDFPILLMERPYSCYTVSGHIVTLASNVRQELRTSAQPWLLRICFSVTKQKFNSFGAKEFYYTLGFITACTEIQSEICSFHTAQLNGLWSISKCLLLLQSMKDLKDRLSIAGIVNCVDVMASTLKYTHLRRAIPTRLNFLGRI